MPPPYQTAFGPQGYTRDLFAEQGGSQRHTQQVGRFDLVFRMAHALQLPYPKPADDGRGQHDLEYREILETNLV